jgi:hypothetical protein
VTGQPSETPAPPSHVEAINLICGEYETVITACGRHLAARYLGVNGLWFDDPDADTITDTGGVVRLPPLTLGGRPGRHGLAVNVFAAPGRPPDAVLDAPPSPVWYGSVGVTLIVRGMRPVSEQADIQEVRHDTAGFSGAVVG